MKHQSSDGRQYTKKPRQQHSHHHNTEWKRRNRFIFAFFIINISQAMREMTTMSTNTTHRITHYRRAHTTTPQTKQKKHTRQIASDTRELIRDSVSHSQAVGTFRSSSRLLRFSVSYLFIYFSIDLWFEIFYVIARIFYSVNKIIRTEKLCVCVSEHIGMCTRLNDACVCERTSERTFAHTQFSLALTLIDIITKL